MKTTRYEEFTKLKELGYTHQQIANVYGCSKQNVSQILCIGNKKKKDFKYYGAKNCIYPNLRHWLNENKVTRTELSQVLAQKRTPSMSYNGTERIGRLLRGKTELKHSEILRLMKLTGMTFEEMLMTEGTESAISFVADDSSEV